MTCRPLPKTVAPLPDELLSGWLSRLAASNHCEVSELLKHLEIDARHVAALDYHIDVVAVDRISVAGRIDPVCVPSMTFAAISEAEMRLIAQVPFQACPACAVCGLSLKHWRRAWAFDCQVCGTRLLPLHVGQKGEAVSKRLVDRARKGAGVLERAAVSGGARQLRRALRAVTFAMGVQALRGDPAFALQSPRPNVRLFCLAAIAAAQSRPLAKAALFSMGVDDYARVALLHTYDKEHRLLATIDKIAQQMRKRTNLPDLASRI